MNDNLITAKITGVAGNTATATLEVSTDFYPIVRVAISSANPENITRNLIFRIFQESDAYVERCKPFIEKMESDCLKQEEDYFIPYLRMWPPQEGERVFTLACIVRSGKDNCAEQGDIYVEMLTKISGLKINNIPDGVIKDVFTYSTVSLELSLTSDADRTHTDIKAVPLIFYVLNNGKRTNVGKIHLSVAPRDVFSEHEISNPIKYLQDGANEKHGHDCLTAVRVATEKLIGAKLKGAIKANSFNIWDFEEYLKKTDRLESSFTVDIGDKAGNIKQPVSEKNDLRKIISEKIKCNIGYHFYPFGLAAHTQTLIVNNTNVNKPSFSILDQFSYAGRGRYETAGKRTITNNVSLDKINDCFFSEIEDWRKWTIKIMKYAPPANAFLLKIQKALLAFIILLFSSFNVGGNVCSFNSNIPHSESDDVAVVEREYMDRDSSIVNTIHDIIIRAGLVCTDTKKMSKEKLYVGTKKNRVVMSDFLMGTQYNFDIGPTKQPQIILEIIHFKSPQIIDKYVKHLKETFVYHDFTTGEVYSYFTELNCRILRKSNTLYFISCWDLRLEKEILTVVNSLDTLHWDKVYSVLSVQNNPN